MHKYQPEGSSAAFEAFFSRDYNPSPAEVRDVRKRLKENPNDIDSRLFLLGRNLRRPSSTFATHLIWLIDNHPRHCIHLNLPPRKNDDAYQRARLRWLRQVRLNPEDVTILYHAAEFCSLFSPEDAIRFLHRASDLDPLNDELPRELSHLYCCLAAHYSVKKNKLVAHKAVEQLKIALARYATPSTEDSYLLPYFSMVLDQTARVALRYDLLDDAKDLGQVLLSHYSINLKRLGPNTAAKESRVYDLSTNLGNAILGHVALKNGDIRTAEEHLRKMMLVSANQFCDWTLADELLHQGERKIVSEYIDHVRAGWERLVTKIENGQVNVSENEKIHARRMEAHLRKWLDQIKRGRIPRLQR